jgi:hypothetical protein
VASKRIQLLTLFSLFLYQIVVVLWAFGPRWPIELGVSFSLLLGFYVVSFIRAYLPSFSLAWRALFAANLAFFLVGSVLFSLRSPGMCMRIPITYVLGLMLTQYWPIFLIRKLLD